MNLERLNSSMCEIKDKMYTEESDHRHDTQEDLKEQRIKEKERLRKHKRLTMINEKQEQILRKALKMKALRSTEMDDEMKMQTQKNQSIVRKSIVTDVDKQLLMTHDELVEHESNL